MQKCFDWVETDLLFYRLLNKHITGLFYHSIKALYSNSASPIRMNNRYTNQFQIKVGSQTRGGSVPPFVCLAFVGSLRSHKESKARYTMWESDGEFTTIHG